MPSKRRRLGDLSEPNGNRSAHEDVHEEQDVSHSSLVTQSASASTTVISPFFDSPPVRAWYSGATQNLPSLDGFRLHVETRSTLNANADDSTCRDRRSGATVSNRSRQDCSNPSQVNIPTDLESGEEPVVLPSSHVYSEEELREIDTRLGFVVPDPERLQEIKSRTIMAMAPASEKMQPCCICELSCRHTDITRKEFTDEFIQKLQTCLATPKDVPDVITAQYSAADTDSRLKGLMLFPPAIHKENGCIWGQVCSTCNECITKDDSPSLPVYAIANGNYIGQLPRRFRALTRTDEQAVALVMPCVSLSVVTGGPCRTIKSHHYIVRNTEGPVVDMLPRDLSCRVRVTMVGHMTSNQVIACKKRYQLNLQLCRRFLRFLYLHNGHYKLHQAGMTSAHATEGAPHSTQISINNEAEITDAREHNSTAGVIVDHTSRPGEHNVSHAAVENSRDQSTYSTFGSTVEEGLNPAVEDTWIGASSVLMSPSPQDVVDIVVRKSNKYAPMSKWAVCVQMFPTLFPAGCGGPTESRQKRLSVRNWILRCLRIHGHQFERHYAFMLLAFDYLATENARRTLYIRMDVKRQAEKAAQIKKSTVLEAIKYLNHVAECRAKGTKPRPPIREVQDVIDLRKGLRVPESSYYGSNIARMRARFDLFGMLKRFGPLQIFFTISPDSAGTYNIAIKSGDVSTAAIQDANFLLMPNRAERKRIAASYPVECARYFLRVVDTVIEHLLGWDRHLHAPKRGGGIFGVVRAFGASAETQIAGDLHAHFAVWLHGFPTTSGDFSRIMTNDDEFRTRMVQLADTVLAATPPCLVDETKCVRCHTEYAVVEVVPGVDAYRRPAAGASPPTTASCEACGTQFKDKDIIDASLTGDQCDITNSQWTDFEKCKPPQDHPDTGTTSLLVRDLQVHYWNHCKSCFKKTLRTPKGSVCRFLKPERVHVGPTSFDDDGSLRIHRPFGCEYVNPYNPVVMTTMKCNHDAQFVLSNGSRATAAYVVKYCFKNQNPVENQVALSLAAFAKAAVKTNALPSDTSAMERGYKILGSMLYTVTNGQEVAAPMAALYILNETPFWFSHEFVRIDLWRILQRGHSVEISVSQQELENRQPNQTSISSENALEQYWKRKIGLDHKSFIEVLENYEVVKRKQVSKHGTRNQLEQVSYLRLPSPKVLVICGKEMPDISGHLEPELLLFYYLALLTLFKPHRQSTLLQENQPILAAYRDFLMFGDSTLVCQMQRFEAQWQDYHRSHRAPDQHMESAEDQLLRTRPPATTAWVPDNTGPETSYPDDSIDGIVPDDLFDPTTITAPDQSTQKLSEEAKATVQTVSNLTNAIADAVHAYHGVSDNVGIESDFDLGSYKSRILVAGFDTDRDEYLGTHNFIAHFPEATTRLQRLRECFQPVPHQNPDHPRWSPTLPEFPEIAMVSEAFQLNFWQHVAFELYARHLLYAYSQDIASELAEPLLPTEIELVPYGVKNQLIGYLGGEAGTGKSTVVEALLVFAIKWGRAGSVATLAFTGVAAINIKGRTMHSARNLQINGAVPNAPPTIEMKSRFSRVILVIIDEISITDQGLLGGTDAVSRSMSLTRDKYMGGKHTVLIGDLLQLPPVAGSPCFKCPPLHDNPQKQTGYAIYAAINSVIFLTKNMRARFDPNYTRILDDLRWGRLSDSQLNMLNTRVQTTQDTAQHLAEGHRASYRPIVVCTNKLRCAINHDMIFRIAEVRHLPLFECLALPSTRSKQIVEHLSNANDSLTDRIPMKLLFYLGMPVMVTHKHPTLLGADIIANGVIGTLIGIYPSPDQLPEMVYEVSGVIVHKLLQLPALLIIKLHGVDSTLVEGFPAGVIGLPPLKASVRLKKIPNLSQSSVTVTQFAVVPAFACTTEKLQGQTCHAGVVVTPLDRRRAVPCQTLYVALSRSISLDGLTLTESITREYLDQFKPTTEIADEMLRLINLVELPPYISTGEMAAFNAWKTTQHI